MRRVGRARSELDLQRLRGAGRVGDLEAAEAELAAGVGGFGDWVREGATLRGKREEVVIPGSDGGESGSEMSDMSNDHRQKRGEGHNGQNARGRRGVRS